ncbi:Alpha-endosulfine [Halotydeus destructor]|nr:Alpha-endosulfine [Halotydeus destructor]
MSDMNDDSVNSGSTEDVKQLEMVEEAKLKAKYPSVTRPGPGFLQKRLQKGQKYFDSGDYNMAKATATKGRLPASTLSQPSPPVSANQPSPTGDTIPTPDIMPARKPSIHIPSKLVTGAP